MISLTKFIIVFPFLMLFSLTYSGIPPAVYGDKGFFILATDKKIDQDEIIIKLVGTLESGIRKDFDSTIKKIDALPDAISTAKLINAYCNLPAGSEVSALPEAYSKIHKNIYLGEFIVPDEYLKSKEHRRNNIRFKINEDYSAVLFDSMEILWTTTKLKAFAIKPNSKLRNFLVSVIFPLKRPHLD